MVDLQCSYWQTVSYICPISVLSYYDLQLYCVLRFLIAYFLLLFATLSSVETSVVCMECYILKTVHKGCWGLVYVKSRPFLKSENRTLYIVHILCTEVSVVCAATGHASVCVLIFLSRGLLLLKLKLCSEHLKLLAVSCLLPMLSFLKELGYQNQHAVK